LAKLNLALRPDEIRRIAEGLGREPTTVELYAFDAQWSEHCSYKSSRHLLKKLPTAGPNVIVGPGEDAGVVYLGEHEGERYCVVVAHESHNHPSQVVPFEGAATGVGGIVRDVLCMGAEVIGLADCLRFGNVDDPQSHQRYVAQQVVDGIAAYGNAIGVPNIAGDVYFHEGFNDNCLVNVIALGLVKESEIIHSRAPKGSAGWDVVLVGKATDASGFGGASFSSLTLEEANQEANKSAVQVPDPFLKNVIMRATYRVFAYLREKKITAGFKDLGAGGIMGCTAELCAAGGYGAIIDLDDVNVAVDGLPPEVIAVGETQERLCWVLPGDVTPEVLRIYNEEFSLPEIARGARAAVIGAVQEQKRYVMRHSDETVMDVPIEFLTGAINLQPHGAKRSNSKAGAAAQFENFKQRILEQLATLETASREPLFKQYDAVVRGTTVLPRGRADAGVIAPIPGSALGVALSVSGNPLDPDRAVFDAVAKIIAVGARPIALTDCLNFGNPNDPEQYEALADAVRGLGTRASAFGLPFVSGNVSLYNEDRTGKSIPPSPIVACVGALDNVANVITPSLKSASANLYFVQVRAQDIDSYLRAIVFMHSAVKQGLLAACKTVERDGLLAAACAMIFAPKSAFGIEFLLTQPGLLQRMNASELYFGALSGWLVQVERTAEFLDFVREADLEPDEIAWVGTTSAEPKLTIDEGGCAIIADVDDLYATWSKPLAEVYL
jgi:phosphoribosylformylglycinamidine synthase II